MAISSTMITQREMLEYEDIQRALSRFDRGGYWTLVRRGRPGARVRILWRYKTEQPARDRFARESLAMRQGILALIDPMGRIAHYASEPMVRSRW